MIKPLKYVFEQDEEELAELLLLSVHEAGNAVAEEMVQYYFEILLRYFAAVNKEITEEMIKEKVKKLGGKGSMIMTILDKREEKGINLGENKKAVKDAINFLKLGVDEKIVAQGVELPLDKIIEIKKQIQKETH